MEFKTREQMAAELGLSVKTFMKRLEENEIELVKRERISPKKQLEILEKITGETDIVKIPENSASLLITPEAKKK